MPTEQAAFRTLNIGSTVPIMRSNPLPSWPSIAVSATATPYDAANSGGSQLGPTNKKLIEAVTANVEAAKKENPTVPVPVDLVTASASGFDPHISPAAADFQVPRVARERGMSEDALRQIVLAHSEGRQFGFLGEARVNVLELNLALDRDRPMQK